MTSNGNGDGGRDMRTMYKQIAGLAFCIAALAMSASAQTNTFPASGNIGIGTTSPTSPLQVAGTLNAGSSNAVGVSLSQTFFTPNANWLNQTGLSVTPTFNTGSSNVLNAYGINVSPTLTGTYTISNGYGLSVNAPTVTSGILTNSYAAIFNGGDVGIGAAFSIGERGAQ